MKLKFFKTNGSLFQKDTARRNISFQEFPPLNLDFLFPNRNNQTSYFPIAIRKWTQGNKVIYEINQQGLEGLLYQSITNDDTL